MAEQSNHQADVSWVKEELEGKLRRYFGKTLEDATKTQLYKVCAMTVRDDIMEKWTKSAEALEQVDCKQLYYLSVEFLMGRALGNNLVNLLKTDVYAQACQELGIDLMVLEEEEPDAGLGNGGLGRLAACFLDSLATLGLPAQGAGIRYEYGLFQQRIVDGYQIEMPDSWLEDGSAWEIAKPEEQVEVRFGGKVTEHWSNGSLFIHHEDFHTVVALPYDVPILGFASPVINTLRLWSARSPKRFDMSLFSRGDYIKALEEKELAEVISKVLYPEDNHKEGKALRLKQHYFFVSATMQNILRSYKRKHEELHNLPDKVAIHINDTHPALAIPELMRILMDEEGMDWDAAWDVTHRIFAYTNHTIMGEALERWPVSVFRELLPRIYMIIQEINERTCQEMWKIFPGQWEQIGQMAIIAYDEIRMANLCLFACYSVNGVSVLHTEILKKQVFASFYKVRPEIFHNITNGVTHRRWLLLANPGLASLITESIGDRWILEAEQLQQLKKYSDDAAFRQTFAGIKRQNKLRLADYIQKHNGILIDPDSIFDVQVKRLHEYKRQLLNILHILYLYNQLVQNPDMEAYPRTFIFGAKASPGYYRAKLIIKLIHSVAQKVNHDPRIKDRLKVVFLENYGVTMAQMIFPAAEVSEQISTAGKEASGTGNMKFMLNGALTVGTLDGANIEIKDAVGVDQIFVFGLTAQEVESYYRYGGYQSREIYERNYDIKALLDSLIDGSISPERTSLFTELYHSLLYGDGGMADPYMVLKDFESYTQIHERVVREYQNSDLWQTKSILNVAAAGIFSSDRSIAEYNQTIWKLGQLNV